MERRRELLAAVEAETPAAFVLFVQAAKARGSDFDLDEFFQSLSSKELAVIWNGLKAHVLRIIPEGSSEEHLSKLESSNFLAALLAVISSFLKDKARIASESLADIVGILHDVMLYFEDLSSAVADVCEQWIVQERNGKDRFVPQTMTYLLLKSIHENAKAADVKRIYSLRHGLRLLDFQDESAVTMKRLLLSCTINPLFLRTADGIKFIVYLFSIYHPFVDELHMAIKAQIPSCRKSLLDAYGEIYFKAWKNAAGPFLKKMEYDCIQDLVDHAIKVANPIVAAKARQVLDGFHQQKKQKGVDEMLLRLYLPAIRPSLHVANPAVRRNAAALLIDAFPLQNPEAPQRELDNLLQEQFEMLQALLQDTDAAVRVAGVQGICRILGVFWELVPAVTLRTLITRLVADMASDGSSGAVRAAVFDGLRFILENHLSQPLLQTLLPRLSEHIHDTVESVRSAFINLLLFVKNIRLIKFYEIVGIDQLLSRLALPDSPSICQRITRLLLNSYFPINKPIAEQLKRAVILIQTDAAAALVFFSHVHTLVPAAAIVKLVTGLHRAVLRAIKEQGIAANATPSGSTLTVREPHILERAVDIIGMLWAAVAQELQKEEHTPLRQFLEETVTEASLRTMRNAVPMPSFQAAVLKIAAQMQGGASQQLSSEYLNELMEANSDEVVNGLLTSLSSWGNGAQIVGAIEGVLAGHLGDGQKKSKSAAPKASLESALRVLERSLAVPTTRKAVLSAGGKVNAIVQSLCVVLPRMFSVLKSQADGRTIETEVKQRVLRVLGKLIIHRLASESEENRDYSVATEFIDWSKQAVVGALKPGSGKDETHVNIIAELCTLVAVELITCGVCSSAPQGMQAAIVSTVSQLILASIGELRLQLVPLASKLVWVLCSTARAALAEPLLDTLALLAPGAPASRQCIVDVAVLSGRRSEILPAAQRLLVPAVAAVALPTTLPASLATTFDQLPGPGTELLRQVCRTVAGSETLRTCLVDYVKREGGSTAAAWRALEVLSCAVNDEASKATRASIAKAVQELVKSLPNDAQAEESEIPPKMTRGVAEQLLADCQAA